MATKAKKKGIWLSPEAIRCFEDELNRRYNTGIDFLKKATEARGAGKAEVAGYYQRLADDIGGQYAEMYSAIQYLGISHTSGTRHGERMTLDPDPAYLCDIPKEVADRLKERKAEERRAARMRRAAKR